MLEKPSSDEYDERQDHMTTEQQPRPADSSETEDDIRPDEHVTAEQARYPADSSETEDDLRHQMPAESSGWNILCELSKIFVNLVEIQVS